MLVLTPHPTTDNLAARVVAQVTMASTGAGCTAKCTIVAGAVNSEDNSTPRPNLHYKVFFYFIFHFWKDSRCGRAVRAAPRPCSMRWRTWNGRKQSARRVSGRGERGADQRLTVGS